MDLTAEIARLWAGTTTPKQFAEPLPGCGGLPALPEPFRCPLDHSDPGNWLYSTDRYGRAGFRRVTCRSCGRFWGYHSEVNRPRQSKRRA